MPGDYVPPRCLLHCRSMRRALIVLGVVVLAAGGAAVARAIQYDGAAKPGVHVLGLDVGGRSRSADRVQPARLESQAGDDRRGRPELHGRARLAGLARYGHDGRPRARRRVARCARRREARRRRTGLPAGARRRERARRDRKGGSRARVRDGDAARHARDDDPRAGRPHAEPAGAPAAADDEPPASLRSLPRREACDRRHRRAGGRRRAARGRRRPGPDRVCRRAVRLAERRAARPLALRAHRRARVHGAPRRQAPRGAAASPARALHQACAQRALRRHGERGADHAVRAGHGRRAGAGGRGGRGGRAGRTTSRRSSSARGSPT